MAPRRTRRVGLKRVLRDRLAAGLVRSRCIDPGRDAAHRLTVVTLHRVLPESLRAQYPLNQLAVTPEFLSRCLQTLRRVYECVPLNEALGRFESGQALDKPLASVTFDDGQLDNFEFARPVLQDQGVRATFFVPVGSVGQGRLLWHDEIAYAAAAGQTPDPEEALPGRGLTSRASPGAWVRAAKTLGPKDRQRLMGRFQAKPPCHPEWEGMMNWSHLEQLQNAGHEIGSHGWTHELLEGLDAEELAQEVQGSRQELEKRLGHQVESFCYPNGQFDSAAYQAVKAAGYDCAVTTRWGSFRQSMDRFQLRRFNLEQELLQSADGDYSEDLLFWRLSERWPFRADPVARSGGGEEVA